METDLQHWRALGERLSTAMMITNPHGQTVWANAAHRELSGYTLEELRGHKPGRVLQTLDTDPAAVRLIGERLAAQRGVHVQLLNRHKRGHLYWLDLQIIPAHDLRGELEGYVSLQVDITAQREAEAAVRRKDRELLRSNLAVEVTRELVDGFSQEIRSPLNALLNLTDLLQRSPLDEAQREYVHYAGLAANQLAALINDVLDFSHIESGQLEVTHAPFRLRTLLDNVLGVLDTHLRNRPVQLRTVLDGDEDAWLLGDAAKLQQVLLNLGSNALKFTAAGEVTLRAALTPDATLDDGTATARLTVTVEDTGHGIQADQLDRLFKPFVHDGRTSRFGGAGLGLMISNHLVQAMGGDPIEVRSTPGLGSAFGFGLRLPLATPVRAAGHRPQAGATEQPLAGLRVLTADDNAIGRLVLHKLLAQAGAEVVAAEHGLAALAVLDQAEADGGWAPDVVLMDLHMPVMDGLEATRNLRAHPRWQALPVVALSGAVTADEKLQAMEAGMSAYLAKPVSRDALVGVICAQVGR